MKKQMNKNMNEKMNDELRMPNRIRTAFLAHLTHDEREHLKTVPEQYRDSQLYQTVMNKFDHDFRSRRQHRLNVFNADSPELITAQIINFRDAIKRDQFIVTFI